MPGRRSTQAGVSLIEALVSLLVMAVGILGIAAVQSTLRSNGDLSRQQAEATRIAQQAAEFARNFSSIGGVGDSFETIASATLVAVAGVNASFSRQVTVTDSADGLYKRFNIVVGWTDRNGRAQSVTLNTNIARVPPELAGTLGVAPAGAPERRAMGRNAGIPPSAVDQGDGTSRFSPPGAGTLSWVFNNASGIITQRCTTPTTCTAVTDLLLSGFVRFSTGSVQPNAVDAEAPTSTALPGVGVQVDQTAPSTATVGCFVDSTAAWVEYFCAVPVTVATPRWSGRSLLNGLTLAATAADNTASAYRVCRYTPDRAHTAVSSSFPNSNHPLDYVDVAAPLVQQNFLVIRAGDGTAAFTCPADNALTPDVNGNTFDHQPAT